MKVYFVRHGETELNASGIKQGVEGSLSEKGKLQIQMTADQLRDIVFDKIISSPYPRARQSTDIIGTAIHAPIEYSELFEERKNPTEIIGIDKKSEQTIAILRLIEEKAHDADWRYSTEENFHDLISRAERALAFLENQQSDSILVVSHGYFIRALLVKILIGDDLNSIIFYKLHKRLPIMNAGISEIELVRTTGEGAYWRIVTINNHQHLVE